MWIAILFRAALSLSVLFLVGARGPADKSPEA
jgi:hypothetical protein